MEYIYAAMILHASAKEITEDNVKKILEAAGVDVDEARVKALVASLENIDIDDAIKTAAMPMAAAAPAAASPAASQDASAEEEEEEEEEASEEEALEGLGALFG
ncbi:MAG TPA: 50S ribosomal protein P1 [Candidatus Methanofastidiosa archaeon]|nr:50S ribosomal protein P1 [Candidatus Methanofastidiosa archaeon]HPR41332.1 50S ribosomal protein P1 [Candidatus Methanofastidiosa archaeon]